MPQASVITMTSTYDYASVGVMASGKKLQNVVKRVMCNCPVGSNPCSEEPIIGWTFKGLAHQQSFQMTQDGQTYPLVISFLALKSNKA